MLSESFEILPYSIENFIELLEKSSHASKYKISTKHHLAYFENYFSRITPKTIFKENAYVDRDFLEDFAGYYLKCFQSYNRFCTRLHFFENTFEEEDFVKVLIGDSESLDRKTLNDNYLGFIVVKPLPQTIIGRTCLKTYPQEDGRCFPITQNISANLFGVSLSIEGLPFQEQDTVVAACATSALWSVFQYTGKKYFHPIPSPVEITKLATSHVALENRTIPNTKGLIVQQMADAIRGVSLEPLMVNVADEYALQGALYAYLRGGIPVILILNLYDLSQPGSGPGGHAVLVNGFCSGRDHTIPAGPDNFSLKATLIDKIYVHDDQIGPYARMGLSGERVQIGNADFPALSSSWKGVADGREESMKVVPKALLIPLYNKIRIPFEAIHNAVYYFDKFFETLKVKIAQEFPDETKNSIFKDRLVWDIYVTSLNEFKSELFSSEQFRENEYRKQILLENLPRFIWCAQATCDGDQILGLLFDATDIEQGSFFIRAIEYNEYSKLILRMACKSLTLRDELKAGSEWSILKWFKEQPIS